MDRTAHAVESLLEEHEQPVSLLQYARPQRGILQTESG